ncbi:hypothetical protein ACKVCY_19200 [Escherichia coli]
MLSVYDIKSRRKFCLTPCTFLCASVMVNAAPVQPKQDVILVTASSAVDDDYVAPGVTTLGKIALKSREVAQSVSVIDRDKLKNKTYKVLMM